MNANHATLSERGLDLIIRAAQRGWSPKDLLHVVGNFCHPLIYRAAGQVPAQISSTALRKEWLSLTPPASMTMSTDELTRLIEATMLLPLLRDVDVLVPERNSSQSAHGSKEDKIRTKISHLLRKAESTPYEEEASALIAKAQSLRQRHRIDGALDASPSSVVSTRLHISAPYIKHKTTLLSVIADRNGCTVLQLHPKGIITVFGAKEDVHHVTDLFASLLRQCEWHMHHGEHAKSARRIGNVAAFRRSFILSFATRIGQLLDEANTTLGPQSTDATASTARNPGTRHDAVVLAHQSLSTVEDRRRSAEAVVDQLFPNARTISLAMGSRAGVSAGASAAERSHLSGDSSGLAGRAQLTR
ncbi:DUF2786 domain-containing protein [Corynebacterium hiratae]|uniref:DUF2786 domain-containing protein n=1 Tax=Corynebacterium aurimucosum TaxID=169292 RepID=A0A6I3KA57_9CORY|nr:DUF2786 domain-containing protein [Corynebacterium aurimucosum]MTD90893.1 DUF2786 domain-containing protein [Corynebacterium aurimucosum]